MSKYFVADLRERGDDFCYFTINMFNEPIEFTQHFEGGSHHHLERERDEMNRLCVKWLLVNCHFVASEALLGNSRA